MNSEERCVVCGRIIPEGRQVCRNCEEGRNNMSKSKLVCNLGMADFFTLPDRGEVWRKKGGDKVYKTVNDKNQAGYICEQLYDRSQKIWLPANERVELIDR